MQRRLLRLRFPQKSGDFAHLRFHTRFGHGKFAVTGGYHRAHIDKIAAQRGTAALAEAWRLLHRHGFPGEQGFICKKLRGGKHPAVRRNLAPGGECHNVPEHKLPRRNFNLFAVAVNCRLRRGNGAQVLKGALRPVLLREPKHRIYKNNRHNRNRVHIFPQKQRNNRGAQQNQRQ